MNFKRFTSGQQMLAEALRVQAEREAEREAEWALNNPSFDHLLSDEELKAQNARLMARIQAYERQRVTRSSVAAGISKIITATGEFMAVNREGLERLRRVYTPAVLDGDARNVQDALEEAGVAVAPISLTVAGGAVRLALRWRQDIPPKPPEVSVRVGGEARAAQSEWVGWNADASSLQGLRLHGLAVDNAALQAAGDKPVLACRWSAEANRLEIDLLPVEGDGDA